MCSYLYRKYNPTTALCKQCQVFERELRFQDTMTWGNEALELQAQKSLWDVLFSLYLFESGCDSDQPPLVPGPCWALNFNKFIYLLWGFDVGNLREREKNNLDQSLQNWYWMDIKLCCLLDHVSMWYPLLSFSWKLSLERVLIHLFITWDFIIGKSFPANPPFLLSSFPPSFLFYFSASLKYLKCTTSTSVFHILVNVPVLYVISASLRFPLGIRIRQLQ